MHKGITLQDLAVELKRQSEAKQDYVVDSRELTMLTQTVQEGEEAPERATYGRSFSELSLPSGGGEYVVRDLAHGQISDRIRVPWAYYQRIRAEYPALLDQTVNTLLRGQAERRMIRTYEWGDGRREARAFLSDRYRRLDNEELLEAVVPILSELPDARVQSCDLTEKRMYLQVVCPRIEGEVKKGDVVQAGVMISNSEVGWGALVVQPLIFRLVCLNGMVAAEKTRKLHIGRQIDSDEALKVLSAETIALDDKAFFSKIADVVRAAVDETKFNAIIAQMREAAQTERIRKPIEAMEKLAKRFSLGEGEKDSVLGHLIEGGDLSAYGALNAFTRQAHDTESYDRAVEFEEMGGQILEMVGTREWKEVANAR